MTRTGFNNLTIHLYSRGSTVGIQDYGANLERAQDLRFDSYYPGGVYGSCSFFIPRDTRQTWPIKHGQRLVVRNGLVIVWEGQVVGVAAVYNDSLQGDSVTGAGAWGDIMSRQRWEKRWADQRLTPDVWVWDETAGGAELITLDRNNRLRFTPKSESIGAGSTAQITYTMPTGETIKRVVLNYDLTVPASQQWTLRLRDTVGATNIWTVSRTTAGSSTASRDDTLGTPRQSLTLQLISDAAQTGINDGTLYGQVSGVTVYSETGNIDVSEVAKDVRAATGDLVASDALIDTPASPLSLVPFITTGRESMASILTRAANFGDTGFNPWAVGVLDSENPAIATPTGEPILFCEQVPAINRGDYEYIVPFDSPNLIEPLQADYEIDNVWNWISVQYTDINGKVRIVTPDDDANLKDTASIALYGQREPPPLQLQHSGLTAAKNYARRYLSVHATPKWVVRRPVRVRGWVTGADGKIVPVSRVRSGQRVKIGDFIDDGSGSWYVFMIFRTQYDDRDESISLTLGGIDYLEAQLAQMMGFRA